MLTSAKILTPSITNKLRPTPVILAPMGSAFYTAAAANGSRQHYKQLFSFAKTAAITLAVPVTDASSNNMSALPIFEPSTP
jgi:hypothetical protein